MSLPLHNEKAQSVPLPAEVFFFMQNQATPTYHHVLKLGLGLGGILNILCIPAIAESAPADAIDKESNDLKLVGELQQQNNRGRVTEAEGIPPQPEALTKRVNPAERRLLISESAFIPEPRLSSSNAEAIDSRLDSSGLDSSESDSRTADATDASDFANRLTHRHRTHTQLTRRYLEEIEGPVPQFSPLPVREVSTSLAAKAQRNRPLTRSKSTLESQLEPRSKSKSEPWSISGLTISAEDSPVQALSVSDIQHDIQHHDIQHIELAWGNTKDGEVSNWITNLAQAVTDEAPDLQMTGSESAESVEGGTSETSDSEGTDLEGTSLADLESTDLTNSEPASLDTADIEANFEDGNPSDPRQLASLSDSESAEDESAEDESVEGESAEDESVEDESAEDESIEDGSTEDGSTEDERAENESIVDIDSPDFLSEILSAQGVVAQVYPVLDEELGTLRLLQLRSRKDEELGILRILRTAQAAPPRRAAPTVFLGGRLGFVDVDNVIRNNARVEEQIYQAGTSLYFAPKLSQTTSLYAIAETNIARYDNISDISYNEIQLQIGLRQRLRPRTFAQVGWRNQRLYSPGYRDKLFAVNYIDALVSHRSVLSSKVWLDSFYQMRLGFADPQTASRFRQTMTLSLNYGVTRNLRTSLLYQLDFDDYTQIPRYDTYQQVLGIVSYNLTPESRLSFFGGTRFGNSSEARVNLDDTFYGAGLNVSVPLF